jgi:CRP-like cAMP-binding protein
LRKRGDAIAADISDALIVSCDIVGHSGVAEHSIQVSREQGLNAVVHEAMAKPALRGAVWASGGDGGHVLIPGAALADAIDLAAALRAWALREHVPLRVTCHAGRVSYFPGADGRQQPVGQGINQAGAILAAVGDEGIVVSDEFRAAVEARGLTTAAFHEPRTLSYKGKGPYPVHLMSLSQPELESRWPPPVEPQVPLPTTAAANAWEALYVAKRRLQINAFDRDVDRVLRQLMPMDFWYESTGEKPGHDFNPFFQNLDARALREVVRVGQLVERRYNEVICHYGDDGDTMFVILRGQVGVFHVGADGEGRAKNPAAILRQGHVVGELAFALNRKRTADLITLADTALLAFSFEEFLARLDRTPGKDEIRKGVDAFITARALEHVAKQAGYLVGPGEKGPLTQAEAVWDSLLQDMRNYCCVITWQSSSGPVSLSRLTEARPETKGEGLFVLVSGRLESRSNSQKNLRGSELPLTYANLPGRVVFPDHEYVLTKGPAKFLHIGATALEVLPETNQNEVVSAVMRELAGRYYYDAFLSYNFGDGETVERWKERLEGAGLRVYVDKPEAGTHFTASIQTSLLDSLVLLAFISPQVMVKQQDKNWVQKEIDFREGNFTQPWIVPVALRGGDLDDYKLPYTMIDARSDEEGAIAEAIATVRDIRSGLKETPLLSSREIGHVFGAAAPRT